MYYYILFKLYSQMTIHTSPMFYNRANKSGIEIRNQKLREEVYYNQIKKPFKEEF